MSTAGFRFGEIALYSCNIQACNPQHLRSALEDAADDGGDEENGRTEDDIVHDGLAQGALRTTGISARKLLQVRRLHASCVELAHGYPFVPDGENPACRLPTAIIAVLNRRYL